MPVAKVHFKSPICKSQVETHLNLIIIIKVLRTF